MKIKKTIKAPSSAEGAAGGAAIADRFKLEPVNQKAGGTVNKTAAAVALVAALAALCVSGTLTYVLYTHWDFLKQFIERA